MEKNMLSGPGAYLIGEEEKNEILDVLESGWLSRYGEKGNPRFKGKVPTFEKNFENYLGAKHSILVNGGTNALLICLEALGIGPGDEVIVPGFTFVASISSILYARAIPVIAEINESLTIDPDDIEKKITKRTKAIIPVHMIGNPCNMDKIMDIAKKHNLFVIEDTCQALGASYKNKKLGTYGHINAFSLNWYKTITTGDGGIVTTDDDSLYERAFGIHDQGHKPSRLGQEVGKRSIIGLNFRVNELTGAVAIAQLRKLDGIIKTLRNNKKKLKDLIELKKGVKFLPLNDKGEIATWLTFLFDNKDNAKDFATLLDGPTMYNTGWHNYNNMEHILSKKMPTKYGCPFDCNEYGKVVEYKQHMLPQTDNVLSRSVSISIGVVDSGMSALMDLSVLSTDEDIKRVANKINGALGKVLT